MAPASAAVTTETFTFTADDFSDLFVSSFPPYESVDGTFTLTFDPTVVYDDTTTGLDVTDLVPSILGQSGIEFNYSPSDRNGTLRVGGSLNGVDAVAAGTDDFSLTISDVETTPIFDGLDYAQTGEADSIYQSGAGTVVVAPGVPEPACISLLTFSSVAMLRRRRRSL